MQRLVMSMMSKGRVKAGFISFWWWGVYHILGEYFTYRNDKKKIIKITWIYFTFWSLIWNNEKYIFMTNNKYYELEYDNANKSKFYQMD